MKHITIRINLLVAAMSLLVVSCTKKDGAQTELTRLENKWKLAEIAFDDNGNGVIDNYEVHPVPTGTNDVLHFLANGTGNEAVVEAGNVVNYAFTWMLSNDTLTRSGTGHDLIVYNLNSISSSNLQLTARIPQGSGSDTVLVAYYYNID